MPEDNLKVNQRRTAQRTVNLLFKEHKVNSITYWGTLTLYVEYNLPKLRRDLSEAAKRGKISPCFVKIEKMKNDRWPHLHFLWHGDPHKPSFRKVLVQLFERQGIASRSIDLQIQEIENTEKVFRYLAKTSDNFATESRKTFTVGAFYHKNVRDIERKTSKAIWDRKISHISRDPLAFDCIYFGFVDRERVRDPRWLSYWKRIERFNYESLCDNDLTTQEHRLVSHDDPYSKFCNARSVDVDETEVTQ